MPSQRAGRSVSEAAEREPAALDDLQHRDELRDRFAMLLQELRVILPGTQVLLAFLLTAPFSERFGQVDTIGRIAYGVALVLTTLAVVVLLGPVVLHRRGERNARSDRLRYSIRLVGVGVLLVAVALLAAVWGVGRLAFGTTFGTMATVAIAAVVAIIWGVLPARLRRNSPAAAGGSRPESQRRRPHDAARP